MDSFNPTVRLAEHFTSVQGEGMYSGVPMTFFRFTGCSVGKKICHHCDTDFDRMYEWKGGGEYTLDELASLIRAKRVCWTGGEPFNQEYINHLFRQFQIYAQQHVETSGTVPLLLSREPALYTRDVAWKRLDTGETLFLWISCSPKPGFIDSEVLKADEVKVIVPGLGNGPGWPTIEHAKRWAGAGILVYLQPRNEKNRVNLENLDLCMELVLKNPELRLSPQHHKFYNVR